MNVYYSIITALHYTSIPAIKRGERLLSLLLGREEGYTTNRLFTQCWTSSKVEIQALLSISHI